ncbi:ferritin-like domain-containing protein [Kitasatospora sp. NPDC093806]|uniref:ferritin-like domain-containing protein n=1 Tax=Kitasatospora sp. NPDC093806 TaxID=3155075 RepID=UPI00341ED925
MSVGHFGDWSAEFEAERERRAARGEPDWRRGARLPAAVWRSLQRFQVGEDGDGGHLIAKADRAGDADYAAAVRLFVAEEQNHARLLAELLRAGGVPLLSGHWSDRVFVEARRLLGLRLELMVLMVAELIAVTYYRCLRDGTADPLTREVAGRILADEERHVPFHIDRLRRFLARLPAPLRPLAVAGWRGLTLAATAFVAVDHGRALRRLGVRRSRFLVAVTRDAARVGAELRATRAAPGPAGRLPRSAGRQGVRPAAR